MTQRLAEAGTITAAADGSFPVILIEEGPGNSADYPREFFTQANADALAEALSFPAHPEDLSRPERRSSMAAIGSIDKVVTVAESGGKMQFKSRFHPAASKPEVGPYIKEFGSRLGLSIYIDSDGHEDPTTGRWVAESLNAQDPYRSVDLVIAPGARGKFERLSESLGLLTKASATAEDQKKEIEMDKSEVEAAVKEANAPLVKAVEALVTTLNGKQVAEAAATAQVQADSEAVEKAVKERMDDFTKADAAITAAKLGESLSADLRARALKGEDVTEGIEFAKKVLAEARADAGSPGGSRRVVEFQGGDDIGGDLVFEVPGFGRVTG